MHAVSTRAGLLSTICGTMNPWPIRAINQLGLSSQLDVDWDTTGASVSKPIYKRLILEQNIKKWISFYEFFENHFQEFMNLKHSSMQVLLMPTDAKDSDVSLEQNYENESYFMNFPIFRRLHQRYVRFVSPCPVESECLFPVNEASL